MFKNIIQFQLERYVKKYFKLHPEVKLVAITGSVGKTSTKFAVATVLQEHFRVRFHGGNHNSELSAPLAIMGVEYPEDIRSIKEWMRVRKEMKARISSPSDVNIIVQELGTDRIGQIAHFGTYLKPDIGVVTAVSPEHMEYFKNIDAVAKEEMYISKYCKQLLINGDDIEQRFHYLADNKLVNTYGVASTNEYYFSYDEFNLDKGYVGKIEATEISQGIPADLMVFGSHSIRPVVAAAAIGIKLGMSGEEIARGIAKVHPVYGRMNILPGKNGIKIIDDSYNSSPLALKAAIETLYNLKSTNNIVVIGDMNELGESSVPEHQIAASLCDPAKLSLVITVGKLTKSFLAPAAKLKGCNVVSFDNSKQAGEYLLKNAPKNSTILFKGSEGGVFLEEAIKPLLVSTKLNANLVRQTATWLKRKEAFFNSQA
jgi:UDP-N-acetylmuramoyl-tripeptide--D-alanyl-D-alanine ligase